MPSILEDKEAIRELLCRYCYGTDTGNVDQWVGVFTEDCVWDGGPFGICNGTREMRAFYAQGGDAAKSMRHLTLNTIIDVQNERARAVSYVVVLGIGESDTKVFFTGFYDDLLVRHSGQWRIAKRKLRPDMTDIHLPK
jgi:3-phenylpropionate/cinnamic acid dioxygenase small subunit